MHKENLIIEWLTNKTVVNKVRKDKYLIQSKDIKHYSDVFNGIIENEVDINTVKSYCSNDAWKKIIAVLKQKKKNITWVCPLCNNDIGADQNSILCDSCLIWHHMDCVKLKQNGKYWFCDTCKLKK